MGSWCSHNVPDASARDAEERRRSKRTSRRTSKRGHRSTPEWSRSDDERSSDEPHPQGKAPTKEVIDDWHRRCEQESYGWRPVPSLLQPEVIVRPEKLRRLRELVRRSADRPLRLTVDNTNINESGDQRIRFSNEPFPEPYRYHRTAIDLRLQRYLDLYRLLQVSVMILSWRTGNHAQPIVVEHGPVRYIFSRETNGFISRQRFANVVLYQQGESPPIINDLYDVDLGRSHDTIVYKGIAELVADFPPFDTTL